ncbi:sex hormone-binding globulin isoform X1 [Tiliqua scincoides]|uniref:sex hormone-binding globulin isoform X1 n=1 Tax=Tiliqua scincoides TaxID=71010 RepID=UPI0034621A8A
MLLFSSAWLLLGVVQGLPPALGASLEIMEGHESQRDQCFPTLSGEAGALNLGQRWGDSSPIASLHIDLQTVTSAMSSFDFRTFDPEGVIFFGSTRNNGDWFVLGLRRGKPEMQIHNFVINISISGGQPLNDGLWHRLLVKNEGDSVTLEVDGDDMLVLNRVSHAIVGYPASHLDIGVGGLLIPRREMLTPMNTAMDGCMRRWNWLNRSSEWWEGVSVAEKSTKVCFSTIRRGSFFPGSGLATFRLSDLPTGQGAASGNWSLAVEMGVRAARQISTLLAVSTMEKILVFSVKLQHKDLVAQVHNVTVTSVPLPLEGCLDARLFLHLTPSHLTLLLGEEGASVAVQQPDFESLRDLWLGKNGSLSLGGSAMGKEESQEGGFFEGCLSKIRVQGSQLDLDSAHYKSDSIWSHSCPGDDGPPSTPGTNSGGH